MGILELPVQWRKQPAAITHSDRENSIARRVAGEPIPLPSQAQDKLGEIILKACAYEAKDRYAAPEQMRLDLEAVLKDVPDISTLKAEAPEIVSDVKAGEDSDATVSMFGDISPEQEKVPDWDNPTVIKQESQTKEDDKKKKSKKKQGKKKIGLFLGIGAAVVILLCLIIGVAGSGGGSRYEVDSSSVNERSSRQKVEETEKSEGDSVSEIQEESPYIYNTIYYGHYSLEEANSSSLDPENSFLRDMEFRQICGHELSVLPSSVTCHPDGSEYVIGYQPNMALGMSQKEVFQTIAIQKFGDEIAEQTEAFYEENIEGQRDCVDMRFHQRKGDGWDLHGYYKMRGSIMEVGFPYVDEAGKLSMEIVEFDIHFSGINMEISRSGYTNTLVPYSFQEDRGMVFLSGYASSSEDAYKGISCIFISDLMSDSPSVSVNFENGDIVIDPVMKLEGDNTITISWEEKWHKWDDGFGTSERVADPDSITFRFLSCEDIGFIMQVDDMLYLYQKTRQEYYAEALQDSIDNVSYDDIKMMNEEELQKAVTVQKSILEALQTSFEEAGIEVDINEKSGKVTMSNSVLFGLDDARLSEEGEAYLDDFLKVYSSVILNSDRGYYEYIDGILLEGHTDSTGDYDYNQRLSEERAEAVDDYCYEKYSELSNYISTRGCASDNLIYDEEGNEDREASRRVEFKVILDLEAL